MFGRNNRFSQLTFWLALVSVCTVPGKNADGDPLSASSPTHVLRYDATYAGYRFAEIEFSESQPYQYLGDTVRSLECNVLSTGILDLDGRYGSIVKNDYTVLYFKSDEGSTEDRKIFEYWFDYDKNEVSLAGSRIRGEDTTRSEAEYRNVDSRYFDSISLIFRIRDRFDTISTPVYLPIFIESRSDSILIESITKTEVTGPEGATFPVKKIKGKIPFATYPGFGDDFEIYMTSDETRIPIKARIEMALGYIDIRLRESR